MAATVGVRRIEVVNAMSVDVEDYFHVNAFDGVVPRANWVKLESRVCRNTERLLALTGAADALTDGLFAAQLEAEDRRDLVAEAYRRRARRVAFRLDLSGGEEG